MKFEYRPKGVCSHNIAFEIADGIVKNVVFSGGCSGNAQGIAALCEGMAVEDVILRIEKIHCGGKPTSCPDQLSKALRGAMDKMAKKQA